MDTRSLSNTVRAPNMIFSGLHPIKLVSKELKILLSLKIHLALFPFSCWRSTIALCISRLKKLWNFTICSQLIAESLYGFFIYIKTICKTGVLINRKLYNRYFCFVDLTPHKPFLWQQKFYIVVSWMQRCSLRFQTHSCHFYWAAYT